VLLSKKEQDIDQNHAFSIDGGFGESFDSLHEKLLLI